MQLRGSAQGIGSSRPTAVRHRQTTCRVVCRASASSAASTTFGGQQTTLTPEQVQKRQKQLQDLVQEAVKISLETGGLVWVVSGVYCSWLQQECPAVGCQQSQVKQQSQTIIRMSSCTPVFEELLSKHSCNHMPTHAAMATDCDLRVWARELQ